MSSAPSGTRSASSPSRFVTLLPDPLLQLKQNLCEKDYPAHGAQSGNFLGEGGRPPAHSLLSGRGRDHPPAIRNWVVWRDVASRAVTGRCRTKRWHRGTASGSEAFGCSRYDGGGITRRGSQPSREIPPGSSPPGVSRPLPTPQSVLTRPCLPKASTPAP